ncbi:MAG: hypothetical protein CO108_15505 [Deltaproteobacteria bacterium CG_4_9_14_3_um_filter_63_12]|nr:MAG: hypothetical protein CO108_15505 [Deltaproteobacteria bacterium CG_4_9_14_3_um_filter_63_12]
MNIKSIVVSFSFLLALVSFSVAAWADDACLYGSAEWSSGDKIDGSTTVSTSWNGKEAFPRDGEYRLCLGSNPEKTITVYVEGQRYAEVFVDGDTRLDIVRR